MPMMHLNVETVTAVKDLMAKDQSNIAEMITTLTEAVHGLEEGAWVGNSASQFFNEYESLDVSLKRQMETMRILAERLDQEIDEWRNAASKLG